MEFLKFFNNLKIEEVYSYESEKILLKYKECCEQENDYIQLYELKNILEVVNIFNQLHKAYLECSNNNYEPLYNKIEELSDLLEDHEISCQSYAYYFYVYLYYIFHYDMYCANYKKDLYKLEMPEKIEWANPKNFDYNKLDIHKNTFGVNAKNESGLTKAFPNSSVFVEHDGILLSYNSKKPYVVIPNGIKVIKNSVFKENNHIKMVIIPDSVEIIEDGAFEKCENLNLVHFGLNVTRIPDNCFKDCKNLKYIIGDNLFEVGINSFEMCVQLKNISFNNLSVTKEKSFYGCISLNNFEFINNLSFIGDMAFAFCKVESLVLNKCEYLGLNAFYRCVNLKELTIINDISLVAEAPFYECVNLTDINIKDRISFRLVDLFSPYEEDFDIQSYNIKNVNIEVITPEICSNMETIEHVYVNGSSDVISSKAFNSCVNLKSISFFDKNIKYIEDSSFDNCLSLTELDINYLGTKIGNFSFNNCVNINDFSFLKNVQEFGSYSLANTNLMNFDFFNNKIKIIGEYAFANSYFLDELNIRLKDAIVGNCAFKGVTNVNCLDINNSQLYNDSFYSIFAEENEDFINSVKFRYIITDLIGSPYLFAGIDSTYICCRINDKIVPEGLFYGCKNLQSVKLDGQVQIFEKHCFRDCEMIEFIDVDVIPDLVVCDSAFMNCYKYEYTYFDYTQIIEKNAFSYSKISKLWLEDNISYIGDNAFSGCNITGIVKLPFTGNEKDCNKPFGVIFSNDYIEGFNVQYIGDTSYYIPYDITHLIVGCDNISSSSFVNCNFLKTIELPKIEILNKSVFKNCTSLNKIVLGSRLRNFNAICLFDLKNDIEVEVLDNEYFEIVNGDIYSKGKEKLYYSQKGDSYPGVLCFESYSLMNIQCKSFSVENAKLIKSNAINCASINELKLENIEYIENNAFINCDNLKELELTSDQLKDYSNVFSMVHEEVCLEKVILKNISTSSIIDLFHGLDKLSINQLFLENCIMNEDFFININVNHLIVSHCKGICNVNCNINNITINDEMLFNETFHGNLCCDTIILHNGNITNNVVANIICNNMILHNVREIKENAFQGAQINNLDIYDVETIEKCSFYGSRIENINIFNSQYICYENCIYRDDVLLYFKTKHKDVTLLDNIKKVCTGAVDLSNSVSIQLNKNVYLEKNAFYNTYKLERVSLDNINLENLYCLFQDVSNIREVEYKGNILPEKFLSNLPNLEKVLLSNDIYEIGDFAFSNDTKLKEIVNVDKAKIYGDYVFNNCHSIKELVINENAEEIGLGIVDGCIKLESIEIPLLDYFKNGYIDINDILGENHNIPKIIISNGNVPSKMFDGTKHEIVFKNSPVYIGDYAFNLISDISIDLSLTEHIGDFAFNNLLLQGNLNLNKCKYIGNNAFDSCKGIRNITLNSCLENIGNNAFINSELEKINIKNNKKYKVHKNCLFEGNELIYYPKNCSEEKIVFDFEIDNIRESAFSNNTNIKTIVFYNVKEIEDKCFRHCNSLREVEFTNIINKSNGAIFDDCNIECLNLYCIKQGGFSTLSDYFTNCNDLDSIINLKITGDKLQDGELNCQNKIINILLSDTIKEIPRKYFAKCKDLSSINIPRSCEIICDYAFYGCKKLKTINFLDANVETIGYKALASTNIENLNFNHKVKYLGEKIFENTSILALSFENDMMDFTCEKYGISETIENIRFNKATFSENAFTNKDKLVSIKVSEYMGNEIPNYCFSGCNKLEDLNIQGTYKIIKSFAFENCESLKKFKVKENTIVEKNAFCGCDNIIEFLYDCDNEKFRLEYFGFVPGKSKLEVVSLKNSNLVSGSFEGFNKLKYIEVLKSQNSIPKNCFKNCSNLVNININGFTIIEESAFENCKSLINFDFKNCVKIENNSFNGCSSLDTVIIPNSIKEILCAFTNCYNVRKLVFNNEIEKFKLSNYGFSKNGILSKIIFSKVTFEKDSFNGFNTLTNIEFKYPVINIPDRCFKDCENLQFDSYFFNNIERVGKEAFSRCLKIDNCINLYNVISLSEYAFEKCSNLKTVSLGDKLTVIPEGTFQGCNSLKEINISKTTQYIGSYAFSYTDITKLEIYDNMIFVDSMIFKGNRKSVKVILPYKKFDTSKWEHDWYKGLENVHKILKFLNPRVSIVERKE